MAEWQKEELLKIAGTDDLHIAPFRAHPGCFLRLLLAIDHVLHRPRVTRQKLA